MISSIRYKEGKSKGQEAIGKMQRAITSKITWLLSFCRWSRIAPCLLLISCFQLKAQTLISVDRAIEIALKNNPQLRAKNLDVRAAQSLGKTAFELPKTDLNFQYGNTDGFEKNDGIQISQTIPFPTRFGTKKNLIEEQVKAREWEKAQTENELKRQVRTSYYRLQYLEHNADVLENLKGIYADFIRVAELRYKTGDIGKIDVTTAVTKQGEIDLLFRQNEVRKRNAYRDLKNLLQMKEEFVLEATADYQPVLVTAIMDSAAVKDHPSIRLLYKEAEIAEQSKKVERANNLPDVTFGYNNISLIGMHRKNGVEQFYGRGQRFSFVEVGLSIPLTWGATQARIRSLDYQKQAWEQHAQWQQQQLKTEWANTLKQYELHVAQFTYFKEQALPNAAEIVQAAKLGYRTGEISYVEYLYALQNVTDAQLNYLKSIQQINETVALIYALISK